MNERILELYSQAIEYANSVIPPERRYNDIYYAVASCKHARLIVVECANIIWHEADTKDSAEINEGGYKILEHFGIDWRAEQTDEHFGVEE